ncbi:MAG: S8 family serine peptidase [Candidatus Hodarchaeota archaeon]
MLKNTLEVKSFQLIALVLFCVIVFSGVAGLLATPDASVKPMSQPVESISEYDGPLKETVTNFAREYAESFDKPALEKFGPKLTEYYNSKLIPEDVVVVGDNKVSIRIITGPIPDTTLREHMSVTSIFDIGFSKTVFGFVNSPEQALKIAELPGIIEVEADQYATSKFRPTNVMEAYQSGFTQKFRSTVPPPSSFNQFNAQTIHSTTRVHDELGINGSGVTVSVLDTGTDFSNPNLGNDALARTIGGYPEVFDPVADGIIFTPIVVTKNGSGYLNVSAVEAAQTLPIWILGGEEDYYSFFAGLPPALKDFKAPSIASVSGKYKFGLITQATSDVYMIFPTVLIDSTTSGVYDTVVVDIETGVYLTGELLLFISGGTNYTRYPGVTYDEFDFSNNDAHKWGDGTEIIGKDFDHDGLNDIGLGCLGYAMDLYGALNNRPRYIEGINTTGSGFALMFDNYGHGTWCGSIVGSRGTTGYPVFDQEFNGYSDFQNTTTYKLPGAAIGAKVQGIKLGYQGGLEWTGYAAYFWSCGFDYNPTTMVWEFTGDHYANISSHSYGGIRLYELSESAWIQMIRDVLSVPGYFDPAYSGQLIVHSAGNEGSGMQTASANGAAELSVGSSAKYDYFDFNYGSPQGYDQSAAYASKGPGSFGHMKPDVLALGYLVASPAPAWYFYDSFAKGNGTFTWWAGTSASCPFAAGVAALVFEAYYSKHGFPATPDLVKSIIKSTAKDLGLNPAVQGCGQIDAYRAVRYALAQATADGNPVIFAATTTTFSELAKIINVTLADAWGPTGTFASVLGDWPSSANMSSFTQHPGLTMDIWDGNLYLGRIPQGSSKTGQIKTVDGVGAGVDSVVAKRFKETTTFEFTVTTNSSFHHVYNGYFFPVLLNKYMNSTQKTAFQNAEFMWVHVSMPANLLNTPQEDGIGHVSLIDWHDDDSDGVPEYLNVTTGQAGEFYEVARNYADDLNSWDLQVGKPGSAFQYGNPMVSIDSIGAATAGNFTGIEFTIRVRMFTLESWSDISITDISGGAKKEWNVTATVAADAAPAIEEGILVITKGSTENRMPLSFMVTATIPKGPDELVIGGEATKLSYDNFAYYIPQDTSEGDHVTADMRTYSLLLNDPAATYIAVNATWIHEDSEFNIWLFDPAHGRMGSRTPEFVGGTAPTKHYYLFDLSVATVKVGIYTLAVESSFINLPPEILTLNIRYLTLSSSELPTPTGTWSASNGTVLTGPNAPLSITWSQISGSGQIPDVAITSTRLSFVRGAEINDTDTFGGAANDFEDKFFYRQFEEGDHVNIRVGCAPIGPDLDIFVYAPGVNPQTGVELYSMTQNWQSNPEIGEFDVPSTGNYTIKVQWWGYQTAEGGPPSPGTWEVYCYTNTFVFSSVEAEGLSVTCDTGALNLTDATYRVFAYAFTGTSLEFIEQRVYTLDNFIDPQVRVLAPNGGETLSGIVKVNFTITDPNTDETVSWRVFYSSDGGSQWNPITSGTGTGSKTVEWSTTGIKEGDNFKIKVTAEDSYGLTGEDESDAVFSLGAATPAPTPGFTLLVLLTLPILAIIPILRKRKQK